MTLLNPERSTAKAATDYHPRWRPSRDHVLSVVALACAALLSACGGGSPDDTADTTATTTSDEQEAGANAVLASWTYCAVENAACTFSGTRRVRYGLNDKYAYGTFTGKVQCANSVFGDPLPGGDKRCWVSSATSPAPSPAPAPAPAPTPAPTASSLPTPLTIAGKRVVGQIVATAGQVIENVHVTTTSGSCIVINGVSNVTIRNSEIGPCGQPGDPNTQGIEITRGSNITIQRNVIHDVSSGVYASTSNHPIVMDRNYVYNVRGPLPRGQMIQMNNVSGGSAGSKVTCNVSDAQPGVRYGVEHGRTTDGVEDHINMFQSPGLSSSRTEIAYNRLRGGHKTSTSGSGFVLGDVGGGHINAHHNTIVNVANVGAGIAGGANISIDDNRIYQNRDAGIFVNLGLMVWGQAGASCNGGHSVRNNRVWSLNTSGVQNPYWNAGNCGSVAESGNTFADKSLTPAIFDEVPAACQ